MPADLPTTSGVVPHGVGAFWRQTRAAASVEFAIVVPILLTVVFAVIDFGRALWTINVATSALREGARTAAAQVSAASCDAAAASAQGASGSPGRVKLYLRTAGVDTTSVGVLASCSNGFITVRYQRQGSNDRFPFTTIAPLVSRLVLSNGVRVPAAVFRWEVAS